MKVFAPAKINLALHITGQRADGYHTLESLVAFAEVGDKLTIEAAEMDGLTFAGPFGSLLTVDAATNLVLKARDALRLAAGSQPCPPVALQLEKCLPISSGIGGGSADAAATLKGLNEYWALGLSPDQLCAIGLPLGADVPMCLHGRPLIASGIGEVIKPVTLPDFHMLLVNPGVAVSTPAIFKALVRKNNGRLPACPKVLGDKATQMGEFAAFLNTTRNDLQPAAISLQPVIADAIQALEQSGAAFARMSGSGATCFGIFGTGPSAAKAADIIRTAHPQWWVT